MKRAVRIALGSGVLAAGLAFVAAPAASAQVRFRGSFPLPHGRISVSIGDQFPIGGYVPYGYDVYDDAGYGYGFVYENQWIPCEARGTRWVIVGSPVYYGHRDYRYGRTYRNDRHAYSRDYRYGRTYRNDRHAYSRDSHRFDSRRDRRHDRWRRDDRSHRHDSHRFDSRRDRRDDRWQRDDRSHRPDYRRHGRQDRRWNR
jgi:hypothetical protein